MIIIIIIIIGGVAVVVVVVAGFIVCKITLFQILESYITALLKEQIICDELFFVFVVFSLHIG